MDAEAVVSFEPDDPQATRFIDKADTNVTEINILFIKFSC